jgi:hypothetical protein
VAVPLFYSPGNSSFAIWVQADNVQLDLNGQTLTVGSGGNDSGILIEASNVHVFNGTVHTNALNGVPISIGFNGIAGHNIVSDLVIETAQFGIDIGESNYNQVRHCTLRNHYSGGTNPQGINITNSSGNIIINNTFSGFLFIFVEAAAPGTGNNTFIGNVGQ